MEKRRSISPGVWIIFIVAMAQFAGAYAQYQLPPLQDRIIAGLSLTHSQYVQCYTAPMMPSVVLSLVGGLLVDRHGAKPVIGAGIVLTLLGSVLRCVCRSYPAFLVCMALTGMAPALIYCNASKIISQWFSLTMVSTVLGLLMLGAHSANLIATTTSAYFPSLNAAYLTSGAICLAVLVIWVLRMKNGPAGTAGPKKGPEDFSVRTALRRVMGSAPLWGASFCMLFLMSFYLTIASSAPSALASAGHVGARSTLLAAFVSIGSPTGTVLGPRLARKTGRPKLQILCIMAAAAVIVPTLWHSSHPALAAFAFFFVGFCFGSSQSLIMAIPSSLEEVGKTFAGTAGGLVATIQMAGATLIPSRVLVPLAGGNYVTLFRLAALSLAMAFVVLLFLPLRAFRSQAGRAI